MCLITFPFLFLDNSSFTANQSSGLEAASTHLQKASIVIYCVIFIVGTLGNGVVIYVTGFKMKKTVNSVWFLNLAVADFLFTTFLIFYIISLSQSLQWPFGTFMCKLNNFVSVVNMFASIFTLTAMSLDRCLSIWMVVWAHNKRTICKAQLISAGIWVIAGVCSTPYATFRTVSESNGERHCGYSILFINNTHTYTLKCFLQQQRSRTRIVRQEFNSAETQRAFNNRAVEFKKGRWVRNHITV
uniref:G-protein coupled receptors family 1 profile domain-containing protein n=1 Tax=Amphilophus citrinellus TaxID=61819 RepID=A0A3Q0SAA5_AMPCI